MKIRLAICLRDETYQERLIRCLMKHYGDRYEFHVFPNIEAVQQEDFSQYAGYLLEDKDREELHWEDVKLQRVVFLTEEDTYKEVYKLMEQVEKCVATHRIEFTSEKQHKPFIVGVFSTDVPTLQLPFSMLVAEILKEKNKTIFLDLQEFSGFVEAGELALEDMLAMMVANNYVKERAICAIGHDTIGDYVYPLKNTRCLLEITNEVLRKLTKHLIEDLGYEGIVFNLGSIVVNLEEVFQMCDVIFLPVMKKDMGNWRERHFMAELERKENEDVLHRIHRMEVSTVSGTDGDFTRVSQQWKWGPLGESIRKIIWEELNLGTNV